MRAGLLILLWLILMAVAILGPWLGGSPTLGDDLTRFTVRVSVLYYAIAVGGMLVRIRCGWVRIAWTLGWLAYLIHLGMAFHYYHHWSHVEAMRHTQERSGFGEGVFVSHAFTLLWTADVLSWRLAPRWHETRSRWIGIALHAFMAFIVFNATVVYETGLIRWAGVAMFTGMAAIWFAFRVRAVDRRRERET
jgi:hypothetical protein